MSSPFVRVLGVALVMSACEKSVPPADSPVPAPAPGAARPATLPTWDSVASDHPEGATNPPSPVLFVSRTPPGCFKVWMGGMMPFPADIREARGRVVETPAHAEGGTEVACPAGQPETLLAAYAQLPAEVLPGGAASGPAPGQKGGGPAPEGGEAPGGGTNGGEPTGGAH
ncbi:MAG: hypothetical protein Q8P41_01440 [Pseudomonadota bacterium]|nr:hypothetical protein [Pseudomonadota bacterium]